MSKEELNEALKADELKDVSGGFSHHANVDKMVGGTMGSFKKENPQWDVIYDAGAAVKGDLKTGDLLGKKGKKKGNSSSWAQGDWDGNR